MPDTVNLDLKTYNELHDEALKAKQVERAATRERQQAEEILVAYRAQFGRIAADVLHAPTCKSRNYYREPCNCDLEAKVSTGAVMPTAESSVPSAN